MWLTTNITGCTNCLGMAVSLLMALTCIITTIGLALPFWYINGNANEGLFQTCTGMSVTDCTTIDILTADSVTQSIAFCAIFSVVCYFIAEILIIVFSCFRKISHTKMWLGGFAAFFIFVGTILNIVASSLKIIIIMVASGATDAALLPFIGWALWLFFIFSFVGLLVGVFLIFNLFCSIYY